MENSVELASVTFGYRAAVQLALPVLAAFDFQMASDEWVAVIGPSGCGKSTLAKLITGVLLPQSGRVMTLGIPPRDLRQTHQLGVSFQGHSLVPWYTVRRNIELPAQNTRTSEQLGPAVNDLLGAFGIQSRAESFPSELSGGMTARVALARALVHRPKLVVLDEPFVGLDEITAIGITRYLLAWRAKNPSSLLLISHDLEVVARLTDRCLCFPPVAGGNFTEMDLRPFGKPSGRSSETVSRIRLQLLERYV